MESILQVKKGKSDLTVGNDLYYQKEILIDSIPKIVPLYDGQELKINQNLIRDGLATISIRNLRSNEFAIKKRNSFFNLHRPELKGLNIVPTESRQEKMLQQNILKEVKTINEINSMKSLCKSDNRSQCLSVNSEAHILENIIKSEAALLISKHSLKRLKPMATATYDRRKNQNDSPDVDCEELTSKALPTDKYCSLDVEIKSTIIN